MANGEPSAAPLLVINFSLSSIQEEQEGSFYANHGRTDRLVDNQPGEQPTQHFVKQLIGWHNKQHGVRIKN
jgi:hypothetical protein